MRPGLPETVEGCDRALDEARKVLGSLVADKSKQHVRDRMDELLDRRLTLGRLDAKGLLPPHDVAAP